MTDESYEAMMDPAGWTDLGNGCSFKWYRLSDGERGGILFRHAPVRGCVAAVAFRPDRARVTWTLVSEDPLTVDPSIRVFPHSYLADDGTRVDCPGVHGYIRAGRWEPCD